MQYCRDGVHTVSANNAVSDDSRTTSLDGVSPEKLLYFYHSDHLGSTSLITNFDGEVTQHVEYIPYGEVFLEERNGVYSTPYLFNAKEFDEETGLYYYGARYLNPTNATWLSVDPLWEDYVGASPYAYCSNNPICAIDPDGNGEFWLEGEVIGNDGNDDKKIYVLRDMVLNEKEIEQAKGFIKNNFGKKEVFDKNPSIYEKCIEIEGSEANRTEMFNIVNQDNGKGGSKAKNNQEHGGYIENGKVFSVTSGPIGDPSVNATLPIIINSDGSTFHSHASGTKRIQETDPNTLDVIKSTLHIWKQHPSNADIRTSTNTDYVFAMRDKKVYIYNSKGIQTSVPMRSFIRPNKK